MKCDAVSKDIPQKSLNCSGRCCSFPLIEARTELDKMKVGDTLEVVATCPSAEKDMQLLTNLQQFELMQTRKQDDKYFFVIKKVK
jgi:TusA-related sulfurtransferase